MLKVSIHERAFVWTSVLGNLVNINIGPIKEVFAFASIILKGSEIWIRTLKDWFFIVLFALCFIFDANTRRSFIVRKICFFRCLLSIINYSDTVRSLRIQQTNFPTSFQRWNIRKVERKTFRVLSGLIPIVQCLFLIFQSSQFPTPHFYLLTTTTSSATFDKTLFKQKKSFRLTKRSNTLVPRPKINSLKNKLLSETWTRYKLQTRKYASGPIHRISMFAL